MIRIAASTVVRGWQGILLVTLLGMSGSIAIAKPPPPASCQASEGWSAFREDFIQADGRVIDPSAGGISTSEGQVYALFFALVAGDRASFERILAWTSNNLAQGDLTARLMAWKWGLGEQGQWRVLDGNAASDADLWLAHILFEAARLWQRPDWRALALLVQERVRKELVVDGGSLGPLLLPGPEGFALSEGGWRINPSYLPIFVLRGLHREVPSSVWGAMANALPHMLGTSPHHVAPDWMLARPDAGYALAEDARGSYDAIRVYLWAALAAPDEPLRPALLASLRGMLTCEANLLVPPERVDARDGSCVGAAPVGLSLALLPFLDASGAKAAAKRQRNRVVALGGVPKIYYERALALFAQGWLDGVYHYDRDGRLVVQEIATCGK